MQDFCFTPLSGIRILRHPAEFSFQRHKAPTTLHYLYATAIYVVGSFESPPSVVY